MILVGIIFFIVTILIDLIRDYSKWLKNKKVNHRGMGKIALRTIGGGASIIFFSISEREFEPVFFIPSLGMVGFWYFMLFDGVYNKIRGFNWWFTGSEDGKDDAKTDDFLQSLSLAQHIAFKTGGMILFTGLYILCLYER